MPDSETAVLKIIRGTRIVVELGAYRLDRLMQRRLGHRPSRSPTRRHYCFALFSRWALFFEIHRCLLDPSSTLACFTPSQQPAWQRRPLCRSFFFVLNNDVSTSDYIIINVSKGF